MRRFTLFLTLAATFALQCTVLAQAFTDPVGFNSTTVNQNTIKALSLPFNRVPDYAAAATSVNAGALTIQTTGAGWAANAFAPFATNPHVVRMVSGTAIGRQFKIASHTSDTLTLAAGSDLTGVAANNMYQIFAGETLNSLFGATAPGLNRNANPALADNVLVRGSSSWSTYYSDPTSGWLDQSTGDPAGNVSILPDQGFLLVRRGGGNYTFTDLGAVPTTNLKTDFPPNKVVSFGNRFPVATTLSGLGLHLLAGWNKGSNAATVDNVLIRGTSSWSTYFYDNSPSVNSWVDQSTLDPANPAIPIGASVVVVRRAGSTITLDQPRPYTLP